MSTEPQETQQMFEYLRSDISRVEGKVDKILEALTDHVADDNQHFKEMSDKDEAICTRLAAIEVAAATRAEFKEKRWSHRIGWVGAVIAAVTAVIMWFKG
jgi:hypothetical protein